jgi:hypothetical protein
MKAFEDRWPIGSTPRLCYALTLWLGPRRKDVAALATASIDGDSITFTTHKTGRVVSGHITPMLREVARAPVPWAVGRFGGMHGGGMGGGHFHR